MKKLFFSICIVLLFLVFQFKLQAQFTCYSEVEIPLNSEMNLISAYDLGTGDTNDLLVSKDGIQYTSNLPVDCSEIGTFDIHISNPINGFYCNTTVNLSDESGPETSCIDEISIDPSLFDEDGKFIIWANQFKIKFHDNCSTINDIRFTFGENPENDLNYIDSLKSSFLTLDSTLFIQGFIPIEYWAWDESGNSVFCSTTLEIKHHNGIACNHPNEFLLDSNGELNIGPSQILAGQGPYPIHYVISIDATNYYPSLSLSCNDIESNYEIRLMDTISGNYCWSKPLSIKDKESPTPYCVNIKTLNANINGSQYGSELFFAKDLNMESFDNCTSTENLRFTFGENPKTDPNYIDSLRSSFRILNSLEYHDPNTIVDVYVWDESDNYNFCSVTIAQYFNCSSYVQVALNSNGIANLTAIDLANGYIDHLELSRDYINFSPSINVTCDDIGGAINIMIRDSVRDINCLSSIIVEDKIPPVLSLNDYNYDFEQKDELLLLTENLLVTEVSDNCGEYQISFSPETLDIFNLGLNEVSVTAVDQYGFFTTETTNVFLTFNGDPFTTICQSELDLGTQPACDREYITATDIYIGNAEHDSSTVSIDNINYLDTLVDFPHSIGSQFTITVKKIDNGIAEYCSADVTIVNGCVLYDPQLYILVIDTISPDLSVESLINNYGFTEEQVQPTFTDNCDIYTSSKSDYLSTTISGEIIKRKWTTINSCTSKIDTITQIIEFQKICDLPIISKLYDTTTVTNEWDCLAEICLPIPVFSNNINSNTYNVTSNSGIITWNDDCYDNQGAYKISGLEEGVHEVIYQVTDSCNNVAEKSINVTVVLPNIEVSIVSNIIVALPPSGVNGFAKIFTNSILSTSGSCLYGKVELRRENDPCDLIGNTTYNDNGDPDDGSDNPNSSDYDPDDGLYVRFCCEDLTDLDELGIPYGIVTVWVRAWDIAEENYLETWITVKVIEGNTYSPIKSPKDTTITCDIDIQDLSITGRAYVFTVCGEIELSHEDQLISINECGEGFIVRSWTSPDGTSTNQRIDISTVTPFNGEIIWPENVDVLTFNIAEIGVPIWEDSYCELIGYNYSIDTIGTNEDTISVIVHWDVIDWCKYEEEFPDIDPNNNGIQDGIWKHDQIVNIITTAVSNQELKAISVYPNPASEHLYIEIETFYNKEEIQVDIYNLKGQKVLTQNGLSIDITEINTGLYIYQVTINGYKYTDKLSVIK